MTRYAHTVIRLALPALLSLFLLVPLACESEDGGGVDDPCDGVTCEAGQTCNPQTGECEEGSGSVLFKARVKDFQSKQKLEGGECYLLYNVYPDPNTTEDEAKLGQRVADADMPAGYTQPLVAGAEGTLEITLPPGTKWGYECDLGDSYKTTYQYNISSDSTDYDVEDIWIISNGMYTTAPTVAGIDLNQELGVVAGRLVWYNDADEEEYVGCGVLTLETSDGSQDYEVRYFGNNDMPATDDPTTGRASSNPNNGLFISANMPLGEVTMTMTIGDTIVGQERIFSEGGAVVISNINVGEALGGFTADSFTENPTPGDCL